MSKSIKISYFDFPIYMLGSGLAPVISPLLSASEKSILIGMITWTTLCIMIYGFSRKTLWTDQKNLFITRPFKTIKFDRENATIDVKNPIFGKFHVTISDNSRRATICLPSYVSEHHKLSTKTLIEQFCTNNKINYTTS